jgi:hypothetical protein
MGAKRREKQRCRVAPSMKSCRGQKSLADGKNDLDINALRDGLESLIGPMCRKKMRGNRGDPENAKKR